MRALLLAALLLAPSLAGCATPEEPEPGAWMLAALDGRWPFDIARASALLDARGVPAPTGALALDEVTVRGAKPALAELVGADDGAAAAFGVALPGRGEIVLSSAVARRAGAVVGDVVTVGGQSAPIPYVATFFEMERVPDCAREERARLCFLTPLNEGEARLRLRVEPGARDAGFLPDLVELGPRGLPAWWNGTFTGPDGDAIPFQARATADAQLHAALIAGAMEPGDWTVTFTLEANGTRAAAGAAGIVRVREPGYLWFDDRHQLERDPRAIAASVLANLTSTRLDARVLRIDDALPMGAGALLTLDDARALVGAGAGEATALLVNATRDDVQRLDAERGGGALEAALRLRALPAPREAREARGPLVLVAPDARAPPPGAMLALAGRAPMGEPVTLDAAPLSARTLVLSPAQGPLLWRMPAGARWSDAEDALDNVTRARTLALVSDDALAAPVATMRLQIGEGNTSRALNAVGSVTSAPADTIWASAAFLAGSGKPLLPRVIVPLASGESRETQLARLEADGYARDER